jgi:hypothetical protein
MSLPVTVNASINVYLCSGQSPVPASVSAIDPIRALATVSFTSAPLQAQPAGQIALSMCKLQTDPNQFAVPVGGANGVWT